MLSRIRVLERATLAVLLLVACGSCGRQEQVGQSAAPAFEDPSSQCLAVADLELFEPGRARRELLEQLHWRHQSVAMTDCDGAAICSITFAMLPKLPGRDQYGATFEAIFVNDRFARFVLRPPQGPWPAFIGDCSWLEWALETRPSSANEIEAETNALAAAPSHVDWGLTLVWLGLRPFIQAQNSREPTHADYARNAALRAQFDAASLTLGMTELEVEEALGAKPLELGFLASGSFRIYGSRDAFDLDDRLHFSNVLVLFRGGRARCVESIGAVDEWRRILEEESTK